jgi:hypothetical protein
MYSEISCKTVKCKKNHQCEWCAEEIEKGATAQARSYKLEGELNNAWMHLECFKAMEDSPYDLVSEGWIAGEPKRGESL